MKNNDHSIHGLAEVIGTWTANRSQQPERARVLSYGAEVLLGSILKVTLLAFFSLMLGMAHLVFVIVVTAGSFRLISGGAHCSAYYRCLVLSLMNFVGCGLLLKVLLPVLVGLEREILLIPMLLCLVATFKWAPLPPDNKPIDNARERLKRKWYSVMYCLLLFSALVVMGTDKWWVWACTVGLSWQTMTLSPLGVWVMSACDKALSIIRFKRKEGNSDEKNVCSVS